MFFLILRFLRRYHFIIDKKDAISCRLFYDQLLNFIKWFRDEVLDDVRRDMWGNILSVINSSNSHGQQMLRTDLNERVVLYERWRCSVGC